MMHTDNDPMKFYVCKPSDDMSRYRLSHTVDAESHYEASQAAKRGDLIVCEHDGRLSGWRVVVPGGGLEVVHDDLPGLMLDADELT